MSPRERRFVYLLHSERDGRSYTGVTCDVGTILAVHNSGGSHHTAQYRPWRLIVSLEFASESSTVAFEKDLKTGSGRAFAKRHFVWQVLDGLPPDGGRLQLSRWSSSKLLPAGRWGSSSPRAIPASRAKRDGRE